LIGFVAFWVQNYGSKTHIWVKNQVLHKVTLTIMAKIITRQPI